MRTKKLISMLLLPAAFVACTDDIADNNYVNNDLSTEVVDDLVLNVSLSDDVLSRSAYAGATNGVFQNFYLEPAWTSAEKTEFTLSNQEALVGDMMGYCLTNGSNAITNLPFYLAGYSSGKDSVVYALADQSTCSSLYDLNLDPTKNDAKVATATLIKQSIDSVKTKVAGGSLYLVDGLDVRKGIVRTNAGVMTGDYVAYYPYQPSFTEPGGIPAVALEALIEVDSLHKVMTSAIDSVHFNEKLFAVSENANTVKGGVKGGNVSLKPLTGAIIIKLTNSDEENASKEIKRITIQTKTPATTDFALTGTVALNDRSKIVPTTSTDLVGISFPYTSLAAKDSIPSYAVIPCYPISGKEIVIDIYSTDGKVARVDNKKTIPGLGIARTYTVDMADLEFEATTRKIFTADDFVEEAESGGDLQLMADINVNASNLIVPEDKPLNIKGAKKLTLTAGTFNSKLTMAAGSHLVLNGATVAAISADTLSVNAATTFDSSKTIEALTFNNNYINTTLKNATIGVLNNKKGNTLTVEPIAAVQATPGTAVTIDVLNTNGAVDFNGTATPYVKTLNLLLDAGVAKVTTSLKADVVNIAAGVKDNPATQNIIETLAGGSMTVKGKLNTSAVINNKGSLTYNTDICSTINNDATGAVTFMGNFDYEGTLNNSGTVLVIGNTEGVAGTVNNAEGGLMQINGYFGFTTTKLNINAGKVTVIGSINGNSNITVAEGAEFIATAANENVLLSTLGTSFINAKYTGIIVSSPAWPASVTATSKKIYLNDSIAFTANTALNGGLVVMNNSTVTATDKELTVSEVVINKPVIPNGEIKLTIGEKTNVTVNGNITNNGTYEQAETAVVWCAGIVGEGTWVNKPNY